MVLKVSCDRENAALMSSPTLISGKSSAGRVCRAKRDLPARRVRRLSAQSSETMALSGKARRMSWNFLALVVMRKSPA